jgi:hypothetical protein
MRLAIPRMTMRDQVAKVRRAPVREVVRVEGVRWAPHPMPRPPYRDGAGRPKPYPVEHTVTVAIRYRGRAPDRITGRMASWGRFSAWGATDDAAARALAALVGGGDVRQGAALIAMGHAR